MKNIMSFIPENIVYRYNEEKNKFETNFIGDWQLLIIWSKARAKEKEILDDLFLKFEILASIEMTWSKEFEDDNFHRLYNVAPTGGVAGKKIEVGDGSFVVVLLRDENPNYQYRCDASGRFKIVNSNIVDSKNLYRSWVGGDFMVHSSDNINEFFNNAILLFGKIRTFKFISQQEDRDKITRMSNDLVGANGWANVHELFDVLNLSTQYGVLRGESNVEKNIKELTGDIDILCSDIGEFAAVANAKNIWSSKNFYHVRIQDRDVLFDIRYVDDGYFDKTWQQNIIKNRVLSENGIFIPRVDDYFFSHLYHALIHKPYFYDKYIDRLSGLAIKIGITNFKVEMSNNSEYPLKLLRGYLLANSYNITIPKDLQVFLNLKSISKLQDKALLKIYIRILMLKINKIPGKFITKMKILAKKNNVLYNFLFSLRDRYRKIVRGDSEKN